MNAPFSYYGGKRYMVNKLIPLFPPHHTYCEVFGGSGVLLLNKERSKVETFSDIDSNVINFYRMLQDPEKFEWFREKMEITEYSKALHDQYSTTWREEQDPLWKTFKWYYLMKSSFNGMVDANWTYSVTRNKANIMLETVDNLPDVVRRLRGVQLDCDTWENMIDKNDRPFTFFYLDPPYVLSERTGGEAYQHEMTDDDHIRLVDRLKTVKGKVMLSGYDNKIYDALNWEKRHFEMHCRTPVQSDTMKVKKRETIWMNYDLDDNDDQMNLF